MEDNVPYMQLGFSCLNDLLKSIPDVANLYTVYLYGLLYVKAVPQEGSWIKHISMSLYMVIRNPWRRSQKQIRLKTWLCQQILKHSRTQITTWVAKTTIWGCHRSPNPSQTMINCSPLVPQFMQPRQPAQQFPSATLSPWKNLFSSSSVQSKSADNNNWVNKNKKKSRVICERPLPHPSCFSSAWSLNPCYLEHQPLLQFLLFFGIKYQLLFRFFLLYGLSLLATLFTLVQSSRLLSFSDNFSDFKVQ